MPMGGNEYLIAPWGSDDCETEILTVELPSREFVVQLEVPRYLVDRMVELGDEQGIAPETVLAERLEINRARIACRAAKNVGDVTQVKAHLTDAREFLSGVEELDTTDVEAEIKRIWNSALDSAW